MSTSGSMNYATSTQEIITEALELLGVLGEGEAYTPQQYTSTVRTLNMMIKNWQAAGLNLFAVQKLFVFLKKGQVEYLIGPGSTDHITTGYIATNTSAPASAGSSTIVVDNDPNMNTTTPIGIQLESGTDMFWTVPSSVVGHTVGLVNPLPGNVKQGAIVYYYQPIANRPMRLLEGYVRRNMDIAHPTDIPMGQLSRVDYNQLTTKYTKSQPLQFYYDPQRLLGHLSIWPTADNEIDHLYFLCQRTLDDFDNPTDEPDYTQEWFLPLAYNLAVMIAPKYGTPQQDFLRIQQLAMKLYKDAFDWDAEQGTSIYFKPDNWGIDIGRRGN